jgi:hypothetical protein
LPRLGTAIRDIVRQQVDAGIDVVNEGEFGKPTRAKVEYAAWGNYIFERMSGFTIDEGIMGVGPHSSLSLKSLLGPEQRDHEACQELQTIDHPAADYPIRDCKPLRMTFLAGTGQF